MGIGFQMGQMLWDMACIGNECAIVKLHILSNMYLVSEHMTCSAFSFLHYKFHDICHVHYTYLSRSLKSWNNKQMIKAGMFSQTDTDQKWKYSHWKEYWF